MTALNNIDHQLQSLEFAELKMISRRSEERATKVMRVLTDPIDHTFLGVNGCWNIITGYRPHEMIGKEWESIVPERYRLSAKERASAITKDGEFDKYECPILRKDGREVDVVWYARLIPQLNKVISIGHVSIKDYAQCIDWNNG